MLLPLGVKFIPEEESDQDSEEEPELEQCQVERQAPEKISQPIISTDMTLLAQSNLEHGQEHSSSNVEHVDFPDDHVNSVNSKGVWHLLQPFLLTNYLILKCHWIHNV